MIKKYLAIFILIACSCFHSQAINVDDVKNQLHRLDKELENRQQYIDGRNIVIDSLKQSMKQRSTRDKVWLENLMLLADGYNSFNIDSAMFYYTLGYDLSSELALDSLSAAFKLRRATVFPVVGFIKDALEDFQAIDTVGMSPTMKQLYYDSGRQMYSYLSSFYVNYPNENLHYDRLAHESQLSLLSSLPQNSAKYKLNLGEYFIYKHEYTKAKVVLDELLNTLDETDNIYARAAHNLSNIAEVKNNKDEYIYYLTLSAISDTRSATLEVNSLQELGRVLFENGDVERAHAYLRYALQVAVEGHATMRMIQTSESMPLIEDAHRAELDKQRARIFFVIGIMVLLLAVLGVALLYIRKDMRRMAQLRDRLTAANEIKETYISQFLSLCSIYMDKLNQFCKIADRKISAGQVEELHKMTKSGKFIEEQSREFYEVFDDAFLHIYPSFVDKVNALLVEDGKIELAENEKLNTDLRILAFMRLGIEDSGKIAQVLNYSINTIYTYRNKLKNRAINRETFEEDIMKISSLN